MTLPTLFRSRGLLTGLVVGMCVSVAALTWFGYRAIREWQRSSALLAESHADGMADLLVTALAHDMRAVQESVLSSADWDRFMLDPPYDVSAVIASAFARYPYPEVFFGGRGTLTPDQFVFFIRSERPPPWTSRDDGPNRFPVTIQKCGSAGAAILDRLRLDATAGRRFSIFEIELGGAVHQVVARLLYSDQWHEQPDGVLGFTVNLSWVRRYYFPELTSEVARIAETARGLTVEVVDEHNQHVTPPAMALAPTSRRTFPVLFFDPLLVAVDHPADLAKRDWSVLVGSTGDPALAAAIRGADRTLLIAALTLAFGLVMTARAVRASVSLSELRNEFVSTATHELKTPIATIRAAGETLVSGRIITPVAQREYAQFVVQEARRLTRLVDNLLAVSRITDVTEAYSFEPLAIDVLVHRTCQEFRQQLKTGGFETEIDIPDLPLVRADRTAMCLLLDNLVDNAIRYSPVTRSLRISARRQGHVVVLEVADKGCGIPEDELEHVTRRFYRGRQLVSNGTGLGLAIVKRIATDHGGELASTQRGRRRHHRQRHTPHIEGP